MKITEADVQRFILQRACMQVGHKTTICLLTLENGFEVVGVSACVDPAEYNFEIGSQMAEKRAVDKVWELLGFKLQCDNPKLITNHTQPKVELNKSDPT